MCVYIREPRQFIFNLEFTYILQGSVDIVLVGGTIVWGLFSENRAYEQERHLRYAQILTHEQGHGLRFAQISGMPSPLCTNFDTRTVTSSPFCTNRAHEQGLRLRSA